ncbi:alpha/beta fold hydrolase [Streptomyces sp. CT34]|uniref:thioesterase II family protein n=1 Tax=Streptomyces sp. CT34 TaxID=1553907 RepID=UPI0012FEAF44|nr:alpha/beta fold hydrolase [Streptomyces sp. CT34]
MQGGVERADDCVVFLPPAGSVASPYLAIGAHLPATLPAVHCEMPGRGRLAHDEAPASVHTAVDRWADDLAALLPGRRFHVFGHSLGALFAYELTNRFAARPVCEVASVLVSGAREPKSPPRSAAATAFAVLRRQSGDAEESWLSADLEMRRKHQTDGQPVDASLALLCGRADSFARPDEMAAWKRFVRGPYLGTFTFDGGHDYYLSGQESIAAVIGNIVERSQNSGHKGAGSDD